ncbi:DUF58 domain-containing protein [Pseudomonas sp. C11]|uniref:DUF58 domain-containing protein n=1 Tax=Pseudomonas sp. C11 TaxID=3075550 RepID=UPI002AFF0BBF|nr:DUF58 domain-containing protein [Pseudomonas sp. C11]
MLASLKPYWRRWLARRIPAAASVRLDQRRIFILPSGVGAAFGLVLLLMLVAAINYQNSLAYGLTFLLAAIFVVAILHTYRNLAGLVLKAGGGTAVFSGEQAIFRVRLESLGREHQAVALGWPPTPLRQVDVAAKGLTEVELSLASERRGWLQPPRLRVESRFPLGLLVAWSWVDLDQAVLVYPQPLAGELPLAAGAGEDEEDGVQARGQGADDFQGLRGYQPGDSKRRLAWKAYSRGHGLQVKDFAMLAGRDLWLDFDSLAGDVETRLSRLCHWVLQLAERQQPFGLRLPGLTLEPDQGDGHREACLRALALFGESA